MKYILTLLISIIVITIILFTNFISLENQLSDCQFECNHLQTKLWRLEELSEYIPAMEQTLPPLVLAELKAVTLMIKNGKYEAYKGIEQPLLTEEEKRK